ALLTGAQGLFGPLPLQRISNRAPQEVTVELALHKVVGGPRPERFNIDTIGFLSGEHDGGHRTPDAGGKVDKIESALGAKAIIEQIKIVPVPADLLCPSLVRGGPVDLEAKTF